MDMTYDEERLKECEDNYQRALAETDEFLQGTEHNDREKQFRYASKLINARIAYMNCLNEIKHFNGKIRKFG
jgi:hypothetical protein